MTSAEFWLFLTTSPPCLHLDLIYITKFTQPPSLCPLFHDPLQCGHHIWTLPNVNDLDAIMEQPNNGTIL